jgi:transketolase C-terminal domain/subunit
MTSRSSLFSILALGIALAGCRSEGELVLDQGVGITAVRTALAESSPDTRVEVLGVPVGHHTHGRPDDLLASFGLDAEGVAERVRGSR